MDVGQRLDAIDQRLLKIEARMAQLEGSQTPSAAAGEQHEVADANRSSSPLLALAGRSILILGGAFLLRAATESTSLPRPIGIALGLLYAMAWLGGGRKAAAFHCAVAAVIAYPIVWEATTRFHVLSATTAALLIAGVSIALLAVARRYDLESPGWIAAAGATFDALLLAYATGEVIPFLLALTLIGVTALLLSMNWVGWLLAVESDLFAAFLVIVTLLDASHEKRGVVVVTLLIFAIAWMTVTSRAGVQVAAASLIGIAAASALVLSPAAMTILWGCSAIVAAEVARQTGWSVFALQSAVWAILAGMVGGLFFFAAEVLIGSDGAVAIPWAALFASALGLVAFARLDFARLPLLAIAACGASALVLRMALTMIGGGPNVQALVRTIVLALAAIVLASIGRRWRLPEASLLAILTLALTGVKVIAQEMGAGTAAIMFVALAIYGCAMLAIARLRAAPAIP